MSRRFEMVRTADPTGISGIGVIAEGVQFKDKTVVIRWLTTTASTSMYNSIEDLVTIHGHEGATKVRWIDK